MRLGGLTVGIVEPLRESTDRKERCQIWVRRKNIRHALNRNVAVVVGDERTAGNLRPSVVPVERGTRRIAESCIGKGFARAKKALVAVGRCSVAIASLAKFMPMP